ncbi:uncharacterized protein LOC128712943 [Anopheles marshallii]|uniref:uncharacterized protein LOC128712943 n=1 Tax=Anopheles marshallii TaxID=1521116 RepID=UPI00237BF0F3|nr:uncharacterized protein LOC128712943 [Anopheles marshallii]
MPKRFILLLISVLPVIFYQIWQTKAKECIDMNVHARKAISCCRYGTFCTEAVDEKCNQELRPQMPPNTPNFTVCLLDCTYREMGFLTESNEIDLQKYAAYLSLLDKNHRIVTSGAVGNCAAIEKDILRDVENIPSKCSAFALLFHACVIKLISINCPVERWKATEICKEVKEGISMCNS